MPSRRHILYVAAVYLTVLAGCGGDTTGPVDQGGGGGGGGGSAAVATVAVSGLTSPMERTVTRQLSATVKDASNNTLTGRTVAWSSSNTAVATVDASSGFLTATGRGHATITATSEGKSGTVDVDVIVLYRSITAGIGFSCDLGSVGVAHCWGYNGYQDGRLGNGALDNASLADSPVPVNVLGGLTFEKISAGAYHSCGITSAGAAYCWGHNSTTGKLGTSTGVSWAHQPIPVSTSLTFKDISAGFDHSCGVTTAGAAYCWGKNDEGQLGTGNKTQSNVPVAVTGGITFASISAGLSRGTNGVTCGVATDGKGYCWGSDAYGELGDGGDVSFLNTDVKTAPALVAGGYTFRQIVVGTTMVCGIVANDSMVCWGTGVLGNDMNEDWQGAPVLVQGGATWLRVDVGYSNACGVTTAYVLMCWGANSYGESGVASSLGQPAKRPTMAASGEWIDVNLGGTTMHTCAISRDRLTVKCFGRNEYGQLGNGTTTSTNVANVTPQQVVGQAP